MSDTDLSHAELTAMFGGKAEAIETNPDEIEVSLALQSIRKQLLEAADNDHVGVSQLARRLHISPSAVSRALSGESDMRISTAVLYARALGRRWDVSLTVDAACQAAGNRAAGLEIIVGIQNASTATPGSVFQLGPKSDLAPPIIMACAS